MDSTLSYKKIWSVSLPIILSFVAENIVNVTDTAFLGRLGVVELGAAGNAGIFFFVMLEIGLGFSIGSQIIIGRRNGEKNYHQIGSLVHQAFLILLPLAFLLFLFVQFVSPFLFNTLTHSEAIAEASIEFLHYRSYGLFFAFCNFIFISFYTGITSTRVLTLATFLQATVNVILDYVLIFGHWGFPELGIKGAAIASVIAELAALSFFVYYTLKTVPKGKFQLFQHFKAETHLAKKMLRLSTPIIFQYLMAVSAWLAFFMIIEQIGENELAISHIVRSIYMVLMIPLFGFSSATSTLVSNLLGEGRASEVDKLVKRIVALCVSCTAIFVPFILLMGEDVVRVYTGDIALIQGAQPVLFVISASMLLFCIAYIHFSAVTGTGKTVIALIIELSSIFIYLIGAYLLAIRWEKDLQIVWCSEFIYFSVMGILAILYLRSGHWKNAKV